MEDIKKKKPKKNFKKCRVIVRNLSFKTNENDLKKLFSPYGNIVEISLPKKDDGKIKGFAFISFDNMKSTLKAIKYINGKQCLDRPISVDLAVPKNVYQQINKNQEDENENSKIENGKSDDDLKEDDSEIEDDDEEDDNSVDEIPLKNNRSKNDIKEGKTIFIRNLDLETDESSLSDLFSIFGNLEYCKICYDSYSGQSKGSAFIKFKNIEHAQKCLEEANIPDNNKFYLHGKQLIVTPALSRQQSEQLKESLHKQHKDKRNLYLAKEGLIYAQSPAAVGVSQNDLKKRLMLEEKKRRLLQNLHYFVSDKRLCIHNLPSNYDDKQLKKLFLTATGNNSNARILWAKVMRNRSKADKKFGTSKGFGFVEFNEHIHALKALRYLNNNPEIFTADRRPIVEFSIENKVALNRKKYRQLKQEKINQNNTKKVVNSKITNAADEIDSQEQTVNYSGVNAKPFEKNTKVITSKLVNRKISEQKKQLKIRDKKLKLLEKIKKSKSIRESKKKNDIETINQKKKKIIEHDDFEKNYLKRKFNSKEMTNNQIQNSNNKVNEILNKKRKWYL